MNRRPKNLPNLHKEPDFWESLDRADLEDVETREEYEAYNEEIRQEIVWKEELALQPAERTLRTSSPPGLPRTSSTSIDIPMVESPMEISLALSQPYNNESLVAEEPRRTSLLGKSTLPPVPSFRASDIQTSTPLHIRPTSVAIQDITTPGDISTKSTTIQNKTSLLKQVVKPATARTLDTPPHVASPIDTPLAPGNTTVGEGRGRRDPPNTPVPLGLGQGILGTHLKAGKKELQTLTRRWEDFNKNLAKDTTVTNGGGNGIAEVAEGKKKLGKAKSVRMPQAAAIKELGAGVFKGLRLCLPIVPGQEGQQADRWKIISKMGGEVLLRPDTAITHVIFDGPGTQVKLAKMLEIKSLADLPEGTVCVKWNWVGSSKTNGRLLDSTPWLSFPKSASRNLSIVARPGGSRIMDISDRIVGKTLSITKKRSATDTDSETESPKRIKPLPSRLSSYIPSKSTTRSTLLPTAPSAVSTSAVQEQMTAEEKPIRVAPKTGTTDNATKHSLSDEPGWENPRNGERDALDDFISGVQNGTIKDTGADEASDNDDDGEDESKTNDEDQKGYLAAAARFKCIEPNDGTGKQAGPNEWLAKKFDEMHDMYQGMQGKNSFSIRGYQMAAAGLRRTSFPITSGKEAQKAIRGIGENLAQRIDEILENRPGRMFYEDNEQSRTIASFKDIYGVGRTLANQLWSKGARSIDDLRANPAKYGLTSYHHTIGLELYDDLKIRIPRLECKQISEIVKTQAKILDPKIEIEIMGSYRRGSETSGDVDFLITRDREDGGSHAGVLKRLVGNLSDMGVITHELSRPHDWDALEAKWMGVCRIGENGLYRRIDILCIPHEQWGGALIYFTGNDIFNRSLRLYARHQGYSLNQRGLSKGVIRGKNGLKLTDGKLVASRTEQEIFDVLGLRWRHPHQRRP